MYGNTTIGTINGISKIIDGIYTDEISVIPRWISFSFGKPKEHSLELCLGGLFLDFFSQEFEYLRCLETMTGFRTKSY